MTLTHPDTRPSEQATDDLDSAWTRLPAAQAAVLAALARRRRAAVATALAAFASEVKAFHQATDRAVRDFALRTVPERYEAAARAAAASINRPFTWTPAHRATLNALTADTYTDLTLRIQEAVRAAAAFHRAARAAARRRLTPTSAAELAAAHPSTGSSTATERGCPSGPGPKPRPSPGPPSPTTRAPSPSPANTASSTSRSTTAPTADGPATPTPTRPPGPCAPSRTPPSGPSPTPAAPEPSGCARTGSHRSVECRRWWQADTGQ
ncbi:hypothetical protein ACFQ2M_14310 [Kitasatospora saccharophila]|uniref:hypothetical protein n=1 Tax=Kitasatospora saccharophila TaxID=407973 RepID=UPI0036279BD3